ncbi:MAG: hypothetical protein GX652_03720 [Burkholderiaceae bacterium]|nr:hypothetical protein [Burkholderiaceae bacterium]
MEASIARIVTEPPAPPPPLYASDPDDPRPPAGANRGGASASGPFAPSGSFGPFRRPGSDRRRQAPAVAAAPPPAHYPWSVDAQHAERLARGGGFPTLLLAGLRAILLLPVRPGSVFAGAGSCIALVVIATLLGIAGEWWLVAEEGDVFDWLALRTAWYDLPVLLLGGAWLAQPPRGGWFGRRQPVVAGTPTPLLHFAAVVLSASVWIVALAYGLLIAQSADLLPRRAGAIVADWTYLAAPVWSYLVAWRTVGTMHRAAPVSWLRRFVVLALLALTTAWSILEPIGSYWAPPQPRESGATRFAAASEEVMELQRRLFQDQVAALQPQRRGVVDLYFIGFAPYASEDVFRKELETIHPLMDERFDTAGRSLRLVSNPATLREFPIATVSNLGRALAAVGDRMDVEHDILVLYLTTHGSRNAVLATDLPPFDLYNLDPATLRRLLDEAGIRNRVLIISACYSGTFIPQLRDSRTLLMTASVADRPSFGCGTESSFTYFGDALFNHGLRETRSFEQAFALALPRIRQREEAEGFEASQPQIAVGPVIRERLALVEKRLEKRR